MSRHIILDRDGTLIRHIPYLCDPAQVELLPTVVEGLKKLRDAGCVLYLHTNQSGIGRGYFTLTHAVACNHAMIERIGLGENLFADICIAPEHPDDIPQYRKPSPRWGMEIMQKTGAVKADLYYIGDAVSDLMTAEKLGCHAAGVNTGLKDLREALASSALIHKFRVFDRFMDAATNAVASHD
jgi:D-glycero-D-manno-heptose 1,7-bisphosphate phosphatase